VGDDEQLTMVQPDWEDHEPDDWHVIGAAVPV